MPNRNVLLTGARWGVGNGPTPDDAERARPAGRAKESQEETDHATGGCGRDRSQRAASAAHAAESETARRSSSDSLWAGPAIEPEDCRGSAVQSGRNPQPGRVSRIWTDFGGRVLSQAPRCAGEPRNRARLDDGSQVVASQGQARRQSTYVASTAQPLRRTACNGTPASTIGWKAAVQSCI